VVAGLCVGAANVGREVGSAEGLADWGERVVVGDADVGDAAVGEVVVGEREVGDEVEGLAVGTIVKVGAEVATKFISKLQRLHISSCHAWKMLIGSWISFLFVCLFDWTYPPSLFPQVDMPRLDAKLAAN